MNHTSRLTLGVLLALVIGVAACWLFLGQPRDNSVVANPMTYTSGENPQPGSQVHDLPVEPAAALARKDLAARTSTDERSIVILNIQERTWNDSCLGLGGPEESCLQALVEGFRVELLAAGKSYFYRTDKTGSVLRAEGST